MELITPELIDIVSRLGTALLLAGAIGLEREFADKPAGLRTYALVGLAAALFVTVADTMLSGAYGSFPADPLRVAAHVVTGIGFIGAGIIIFRERERELEGLTTAAGLWAAAAVGIAAGLGLYLLATVATVLALVILTVLWFFEYLLEKYGINK